MINLIKLGVVISLLLLIGQSHGAVWTISYPHTLSESDKQNEYPLAVLKLALESTGVRYTLVASDKAMFDAKAIRQLKENRDINIFWGMTNKQREGELLPIRIPIAKGLTGWRVALIRKSDERRFSEVTSLPDLLNLKALHVKDWPGTTILQSNGFNVLTGASYQTLITELDSGKGDFFPHSILDIAPKVDHRADHKIVHKLGQQSNNSNLIVAKQFVLQYPAASYFFVNKSNATLANLVETGLRRAIESGELDKLFNSTFNEVLSDLNLPDRQIYRLSNPLLSDETPLNDPSLWYELKTQ